MKPTELFWGLAGMGILFFAVLAVLLFWYGLQDDSCHFSSASCGSKSVWYCAQNQFVYGYDTIFV